MTGWDWAAFRKYLFNPYLLDGAWTTVWLSVAVMSIGLLLGLAAALMRMSRHRVPRSIARFYIWLMRGTPLLVQLIIIYTGLPQLGIRLSVIGRRDRLPRMLLPAIETMPKKIKR